jgi:hypothetical protein
MHALFSVLLMLAGSQVVGGPTDGQAAPVPRPGFVPLPASAARPKSVENAQQSLPHKDRQWWRKDWMLSLEGVTHAPIDVGLLTVLETPIRVRLGFGYGWVPSGYSGLLTGIAAQASSDPQVSAILNHASYQGRTFRGQIGVRPFRSLGLYADAGFARVEVDGALDLATSGIPALEGLGGGYRAQTTMDMWLMEIGAQEKLLDSIVVGVAIGLMRTSSAQTTIVSVNGAPQSPALGLAAKAADDALKTYGYIPTITLRLGFDFLSLRSWFGPS